MADVVLSVPALISRTAVYAIRVYGAVGGALSDGRPYPYRATLGQILFANRIIAPIHDKYVNSTSPIERSKGVVIP